MKCHELMKQLAAYLDEDENSPLCKEFEKHLGNCETCKVVVDNVKNSIKLVCDNTDTTIPEDVKARLHQCLKEHWHKKENPSKP